MSTPDLPHTLSVAAVPAPVLTALAVVERSADWHRATAEQKVVLRRIAAQRDRLAAGRQAQLQAKTLRSERQNVPADAPLPERLAVFARLHPVASAAVVGLALFIGPRKLLRYGGTLLPLLSKLRR